MGSRLTNAVDLCLQSWQNLLPHVIGALTPGLFGIRIRPLATDEQLEPDVLVDQGIMLVQLNGAAARNKRIAGYCLLYEGAAIVHQYTSYITLSYSDPNEIKFREPKVVYDDSWVRLLRFGLAPHDWFLGCRKKTEMQNVDLSASAAHQRFSGGWKDGT
jgi:hypothetical protein